jgi:hypothetical protein
MARFDRRLLKGRFPSAKVAPAVLAAFVQQRTWEQPK